MSFGDFKNWLSEDDEEEKNRGVNYEVKDTSVTPTSNESGFDSFKTFLDTKPETTPSQEAAVQMGTKEPEEEEKSKWGKIKSFGKKLLFGEEKEGDKRTGWEKAQELFIGFESKSSKESREKTRERMQKIQRGEITGEVAENVDLQMYEYTKNLLRERADIDAFIENTTGSNRYDLSMDRNNQYKTTDNMKLEREEGKKTFKTIKGESDIVDKKTGKSIFSDEQRDLYNALYSDKTTIGALNETEKTFQEIVGERYESSGIVPQNLELFYSATQVFDETKATIAENYQEASKKFTSLVEEGKGWEDLTKKEQTDIVLGYGLDVEGQLETPEGFVAAATNIVGQSLGYGMTMAMLSQSSITPNIPGGATLSGISGILEVTGKNLLNAIGLNPLYDEASQERYYEMTTPEYAYAVDEVGNLAIEKLQEARREEGEKAESLSQLGTLFETFSETWGEILGMTSDLVLNSLVKTKVFNSFASWVLKRKSKFAETTVNQLLREGKFDGPFGEFFEEEFLEPISALIENREYYGIDTPEGKERMATEFVGFILMGGFGNVAARSELKDRMREVEEGAGGEKGMSEIMEEKEKTILPPVIEEELKEGEEQIEEPVVETEDRLAEEEDIVVYRGGEGNDWVSEDKEFAKEYGETRKMLLDKDANILELVGEVADQLASEYLEKQVEDSIATTDLWYEVTDKFNNFLVDKGYDGFINDDNIYIANKEVIKETQPKKKKKDFMKVEKETIKVEEQKKGVVEREELTTVQPKNLASDYTEQDRKQIIKVLNARKFKYDKEAPTHMLYGITKAMAKNEFDIKKLVKDRIRGYVTRGDTVESIKNMGGTLGEFEGHYHIKGGASAKFEVEMADGREFKFSKQELFDEIKNETKEEKVETETVTKEESKLVNSLLKYIGGNVKLSKSELEALHELQIGVDELKHDKDLYTKLYRIGDIKVGEPTAFSATKTDSENDIEYKVHKEDIVIYLNSKEFKEMLKGVDINLIEGSNSIENLLEVFDTYGEVEDEVIAIPTEEVRREKKKYTTAEITKRTKELGTKAFKDQLKRVPTQDKKLTELMKDTKAGEGKPLIQAWLDGWDEANLAEETEEEGKKVVKEVKDLVGNNQKRITYKGYEFITTEYIPERPVSFKSKMPIKDVLNLYGQTKDGWTLIDNKYGFEAFTNKQLDGFIEKYKERLIKAQEVKKPKKVEPKKVKIEEVRREAKEYPRASNFAYIANRKYGLSTEQATEIWNEAKKKEAQKEIKIGDEILVASKTNRNTLAEEFVLEWQERLKTLKTNPIKLVREQAKDGEWGELYFSRKTDAEILSMPKIKKWINNEKKDLEKGLETSKIKLQENGYVLKKEVKKPKKETKKTLETLQYNKEITDESTFKSPNKKLIQYRSVKNNWVYTIIKDPNTKKYSVSVRNMETGESTYFWKKDSSKTDGKAGWNTLKEAKKQIEDFRKGEWKRVEPKTEEPKPKKILKGKEKKLISSKIDKLRKVIYPGNKKPSLPILNNVYVKNGRGLITDLEMSIEFDTPLEDGLYKEEFGTYVKDDTYPVEDYPEKITDTLEKKVSTEISGKDLITVLDNAKDYVSTDDIKPVIEGVQLSFKDGVMQATATNALMMYKEAVKTSSKVEGNFLVSRAKGLSKAVGMFTPAKTKVTGYDKVTSFKFDDIEITARNIEGDYPDTETIIPTAPMSGYTVKTADLKKTVNKYIKLIKKKDFRAIPTYFKDTGDKILIGINPNNFGGEDSDKLIMTSIPKVSNSKLEATKESKFALVMPMQVNDRITNKLEKEGLDSIEPVDLRLLKQSITSIDSEEIGLHKSENAYKPIGLTWGKRMKFKKPVKFKEGPPLSAPSGLASTGVYSGIESKGKEVGTVKPMELPEITKLYGEISGMEATIRKSFRGKPKLGLAKGRDIQLLNTIFQDSKQAQAVFAHEIGHVVDFLPEGTVKRGRLIGHIASLGRNMKQVFGEMKDKEIKEEAYKLSKKWFPFDEELADAEYIKYRKSARELYADMVSVMINDPALLKQEAPKFWKGWFEYLHKKPEVKQSFLKMWDLLLKDRSEILTQRDQSIRDMFRAGEEKNVMVAEVAQKEKKIDFMRQVKNQLYDKNSEIIAQKKKAKEKGIEVSSIEDPEYAVEGLPYVNGYQKDFVQTNYQSIKNNLEENGLVWEDLAQYLFLDRIVFERGELTAKELWDSMEENLDEEMYKEITKLIPNKERTGSVPKQLKKIHELYKGYIDEKGMGLYESIIVPALPNRLGIANPLGFNTETAKEQKDFIAQKLGKEKMKVLTKAVEDFRNATQKVLNLEGAEDFFKADTLKEMRANPAYATFQVIDYMDTYISARVKKQIGSLKSVSNVATSTVQKNLATISAIERNKAKNITIDFIKKDNPEDISEARTVWNGKGYDFLEPKSKKLGLLEVMKEGKKEGYIVDKYIANAFNVSSDFELHAVVKVLQLVNRKWFRPAYVGLNVGFQTFNFVRDFKRSWKNTPHLTFVRAIKRYFQASPAAWARATGKENKLLSEMYQSKALSITYSDIIEGATEESKQIDKIMNKYGLVTHKEETKKIKQLFNKFFNALETTGDYIESIPKVAGWIELKEQGNMEANEMAHFVRNYIGSPNFLRKGSKYTTTNNVLLFSNAIKEGWRSDIKIMTDPKTRSGYWFKTAQKTLLPKLLMFLALKGVFGEWLKDFFEKNSEYDLTNYIILPLGKINGQALTLRIPEDETGRIIGGLFWKALNIAFNDGQIKTSNFADMLGYLGGQLPTVSPAGTLGASMFAMLTDRNPYDAFRNRNVINPYTFEKGGIEKWKEYGEWLWVQGGGRILYIPYADWEEEKKAAGELHPIQEAAHIPGLGNLISRWVKLTDYGVQEKEYAKEKQAKKEKAREDEAFDKKISTSVDKFVENPSVNTMKTEVRTLQEEKLGERPFGGWKEDEARQATQIRKDFKWEYLRASGDDIYKPLLKSGLQNSEKLVEVEGAKEELSNSEFIDYLKTLRKFEVISLQFIELMRDEKIIPSGLASSLKRINQENYYLK